MAKFQRIRLVTSAATVGGRAERQRRGVIPAWGSAPGRSVSFTIPSAEGAIDDGRKPVHPWEDGAGFQP